MTEFKDDRGIEKAEKIKKDKWNRQIMFHNKIIRDGQESFYNTYTKKDYINMPEKKVSDNSESSTNDSLSFDDMDRGRMMENQIANYRSGYRKNRSESPPAKCNRTRHGQNSGKAKACPYCRPEICKRMANVASIRKEVRNFEKGKF